MNRDYVHVVPMKGSTYFYLRPPKHLHSILPKRIRLDVSTREEAARVAAEIIAGAALPNSTSRHRPRSPVPLTRVQREAVEEASEILRAVGLGLIPIRLDSETRTGQKQNLANGLAKLGTLGPK